MDDLRASRQREVDENLEFFITELPMIGKTQLGRYALLRHRNIIGFFDTPGDAINAGNIAYADKLFSIQQVTDRPVELGFFSHAGNLGPA